MQSTSMIRMKMGQHDNIYIFCSKAKLGKLLINFVLFFDIKLDRAAKVRMPVRKISRPMHAMRFPRIHQN